jgi:hypothetical protein
MVVSFWSVTSTRTYTTHHTHHSSVATPRARASSQCCGPSHRVAHQPHSASLRCPSSSLQTYTTHDDAGAGAAVTCGRTGTWLWCGGSLHCSVWVERGYAALGYSQEVLAAATPPHPVMSRAHRVGYHDRVGVGQGRVRSPAPPASAPGCSRTAAKCTHGQSPAPPPPPLWSPARCCSRWTARRPGPPWRWRPRSSDQSVFTLPPPSKSVTPLVPCG